MANKYVPARGDMVWLDFEPQKGKEIGKYRSALILSSNKYAAQTGLVICCPISTSIRGGTTEVPIVGLNQPSVVAAAIVNTLSWQQRKIKFITKADSKRSFVPTFTSNGSGRDFIKLS